MDGAARTECVCVGEIGENCYLLMAEGRDDCLVIDPGDEPEKIRSRMQGRSVAAILLTHGHFDHIGAVRGLAEPDTEILIHEADARLLTDPGANCSWMLGPVVTAPKATRLLHDGDELELAGFRVRVIHTPGHTPGSCCFAIGEDLFTGDTVMRGGYGRTDLPGGSESQLRDSLRRLRSLADGYRLLGGHG